MQPTEYLTVTVILFRRTADDKPLPEPAWQNYARRAIEALRAAGACEVHVMHPDAVSTVLVAEDVYAHYDASLQVKLAGLAYNYETHAISYAAGSNRVLLPIATTKERTT